MRGGRKRSVKRVKGGRKRSVKRLRGGSGNDYDEIEPASAASGVVVYQNTRGNDNDNTVPNKNALYSKPVRVGLLPPQLPPRIKTHPEPSTKGLSSYLSRTKQDIVLDGRRAEKEAAARYLREKAGDRRVAGVQTPRDSQSPSKRTVKPPPGPPRQLRAPPTLREKKKIMLKCPLDLVMMGPHYIALCTVSPQYQTKIMGIMVK